MMIDLTKMTKWERKNKAIEHKFYCDHTFSDDIGYSTNHSFIYNRDSVFGATDIPSIDNTTKYGTDTIVIDSDSVTEVFKSEGHVAVLNFASYKNPGGQFLEGSPAQEETLCHNSVLYNILINFYDSYYKPHLNSLNRALYTDELLYSKDVVFFDDSIKKKVDVITCAAPNAGTYERYNGDNKELIRDVMRDRIELILEVARINKVETLILGAFGCGVFKNDPYMVAKEFKRWLDDKYLNVFKEVIFPIPSGRNNNLEAFIKTFIQ